MEKSTKKSKVEQAKIAQGWIKKPIPKTCANCRYFHSEIVTDRWGFEQEKNVRCTVGNFKTLKMSTCNAFAERLSDVIKSLGGQND